LDTISRQTFKDIQETQFSGSGSPRSSGKCFPRRNWKTKDHIWLQSLVCLSPLDLPLDDDCFYYYIISDLIPFIEGLYAQIYESKFEIISGLQSHLVFLFRKEKYVKGKSTDK